MYPSVEMIAEGMGAVAGILVLALAMYLLFFGIAIATYILYSLGLYTIAMRRGIKNPWMAWLPVTNMWILGSISDQYHYVMQGRICNRRKVLLGLGIAMLAAGLAFFAAYVSMFIKVLLQVPEVMYGNQGQLTQVVLPAFFWILGICLLMWALAVITVVVQYICLYDLYASCSPENKVLFLVLSILVNVTLPFFVFACRKKDGGMPPRRDEVPTALPIEPQQTEEPQVFTEE